MSLNVVTSNILLLLLLDPSSAFTAPSSGARDITPVLRSSKDDSGNDIISIDVSDLGLTMEDLNAPLPEGFLQGIETSGYESTSRLPDVNDDACMWNETPEKMTVTLAIPGLRGQPSMCFDTLTAKSTMSVSAFGRVVWSCILRGEVKPETAVTTTRDGPDFIPIIEYEVEKANPNKRWGGFILQVGEDSLI